MLLHFFVAAGFGQTKWLSAFFKKQFLVCRSYFFLVLLSAFFVAVGLDNELKLLIFLVAAGFVLFWLAVFNFIPQVVVLLFFSFGLAVTEWRFAFSKNGFLSHAWSFQGLRFVLRFSVDKITSLVNKKLYAGMQ